MIRALAQRKRQVLVQVEQMDSDEGGLAVEVMGALAELAQAVLGKERVLEDAIGGCAFGIANMALVVATGATRQILVMHMDFVLVRY